MEAKSRIPLKKLRRAALLSFQSNSVPLLFSFLACVLGTVIALIARHTIDLRLYSGFTILVVPFYIVTASLLWLGIMGFRRRARHPFLFDARNLFLRLHVLERAANAIPIIVFTPMLFSIFTAAKSSIPDINPFSWDKAFAAADLWLHGGTLPWEWLRPVIERPLAVAFFSYVYSLWYVSVPVFLVWQAFSLSRLRVRAQYLMSFFLCWFVLGNGMALLFSSAGPCFYGRLMPDERDPFAPLMALLHDADKVFPVWSLAVQDTLWTVFSTGGTIPGDGISAMPSLHVSIAVLMALTAHRIWKPFGVVMAVFAVLVMVGSVVLGWHYAIDGYVAAGATVAIWKGAGILQTMRWSRPSRRTVVVAGRTAANPRP